MTRSSRFLVIAAALVGFLIIVTAIYSLTTHNVTLPPYPPHTITTDTGYCITPNPKITYHCVKVSPCYDPDDKSTAPITQNCSKVPTHHDYISLDVALVLGVLVIVLDSRYTRRHMLHTKRTKHPNPWKD